MEMTQWSKCLLHECEVLSSDPQCPCTDDITASMCNPGTGDPRVSQASPAT